MLYSVDVNDEYKKSKSKLLRCSLLFAGILAITLTADTLLIILSKENYIPSLIIAIVITSLFGWFAIFFFSSLYGDMNKRYRYFKGYESGEKSTEEVQVLTKIGDMCRINGLYAYPIRVKSFDGLTSVDKVIYVLNNSLDVKEDDRLTITTYQRIIIEAESHL